MLEERHVVSKSVGFEKQGLRERKKLRTRTALEEVAVELFEKKGFESTTVEEIAMAADVSPRTFFRYFGSKEDVVFGHQEEHLAQLRACLAAQPADIHDGLALTRALISFAEYCEREQEIVLSRAKLVDTNPSLQRRTLQAWSEWVLALANDLAARRGAPFADLRQCVQASVALVALTSALGDWARTDAAEPLPEITRRVISFTADAVVAAD